jgi:hypothetical protein
MNETAGFVRINETMERKIIHQFHSFKSLNISLKEDLQYSDTTKEELERIIQS